MNIELARRNMIQNQIRSWEVLNPKILNSLSIVKREQFVPEAYQTLAFGDFEIPLPCDQHMLAPKIEARILQEAAPSAQAQVLEIGTGSGYMAALLAQHTQKKVSTVEIHSELCTLAQRNLRTQGNTKVEVIQGNGAQGWPQCAPYEVIVISGGLSILPPELLMQLDIGGRLCAFVGTAPIMKAQCITRISQTEYRTKDLFETWVKPLENTHHMPHFRF